MDATEKNILNNDVFTQLRFFLFLYLAKTDNLIKKNCSPLVGGGG